MPKQWVTVSFTGDGSGVVAGDAGSITGLTGRYEYRDLKNGKGLRLCLAIACTPPTPPLTFRGLATYYENPDRSAGSTTKADGSVKADGSTKAGGEWSPAQGPKVEYEAGQEVIIEDLDPVEVSTDIRVYANPFNVDGKENKLVRANTTGETPSVVITCLPPEEGPPSTGKAPLVEFFTVQTTAGKCDHYAPNGDGQRALFVEMFWQIPAGDWGGTSLFCIRLDGTHQRLTQGIWFGDDYRAEITNFPFVDEPVRIYALSANKKNQLNEYVEGITPSVDVILAAPPIGPAGEEYTSRVLGFDLGEATYLPPNAQGQTGNCVIPMDYTGPTDDPSYAGGVVWAIVPWQTEHVQMSGLAKNGGIPLNFPYVPGDPQLWTIYVLSQSVNGKSNTYVDSGPYRTPQEDITINPPALGGAGVEYTSLVSTIAPGATIENRVTVDGIEEWRLKLQWSPPNDNTFGQMKYYIQKMTGATNEYLESELAGNTGTVTYTKWRQFIAGETYKVWFVSVDVNTQENSIVSGTTPSVTGLAPGVTTTGSMEGGRIKPGTIVTAAAFAATLKPPEVVSALPSLPSANYPVGRLVVLTTDGKLYRNVSNSWNKAVDGADVINANLIIAGSVVAGAIGTSQLFAGEILLGQGGGKPTRFKVVDSLGGLVVFMGDDSTIPFNGIYTKRLKVAPTIASTSPSFELNGTTMTIDGATFTQTLNNTEVRIANDLDSTYSARVGVSVRDTSIGFQSKLMAQRLIMTDNASNAICYLNSLGSGQLIMHKADGTKTINLTNDAGPFLLMQDTVTGFSLRLTLFATTPELQMNGNKILGQRKTGWGLPSASLSRAALGSGASLSDVISILAALITDLHGSSSSHGLIGT